MWNREILCTKGHGVEGGVESLAQAVSRTPSEYLLKAAYLGQILGSRRLLVMR